MLRKLVLICLVFLLFVASPISVFAVESSDTIITNSSIEEIIDDFHTLSFLVQTNHSETLLATSNLDNTMDLIRKTTVSSLLDAGYQAYDVNADTYSYVRATLNTDLEKICSDPNDSYIIVISGENNSNIASASSSIGGTADASFNYTYNGTTYTMRYLTVTAANNPDYAKASTANLLESKSLTLIQNCLDSAIAAYFDALTKIPLGTFASICGLSISNFDTSQSATLNMNAGTNWTRVYTQIYNSNTGDWVFASSVEYAKIKSYMSGLYYDSSSNAYKQVPENALSDLVNSSNYANLTWRKENAVLGYLTNSTIFDMTGAVSYTHGNKTVIKHEENFKW